MTDLPLAAGLTAKTNQLSIGLEDGGVGRIAGRQAAALRGETMFYDWRTKGGRLAELLEFARVRPLDDAGKLAPALVDLQGVRIM